MEDKILQLAMDAIAILVPALLAIGLEVGDPCIGD